MREAELLSKIVIDGNMERAITLVKPEYITAFGEVWDFLVDYYKQFGLTPNRATLATQFEDFPFEQTENQFEWVLDEVKQDFIGGRMRKLLSEVTDMNEINPRQAARQFMMQSELLRPYLGDDAAGIELHEEAKPRLDFLQCGEDITEGLTTGFSVLDDLTHGTQAGEIEFIFGRPGEGKTYLMLYGAHAAWREQDAVVSFISPEMDSREIGERFDAVQFHHSMTALYEGRLSEQAFEDHKSAVLAWVAEKRPNFFFYGANDLGRSFDTADIAAIIRRDKPALLCVDGLLFIEPVRRDFKDIRTRLLYVCDELKRIVIATGVRLRCTHQANRQSAITTMHRTKSLTWGEWLPDIHHLAEADATGQFANRAIGIRSFTDERLYMVMRKNRRGKKNVVISCHTDYDRGIFDDVRLEDYDEKPGKPTARVEAQVAPELAF